MERFLLLLLKIIPLDFFDSALAVPFGRLTVEPRGLPVAIGHVVQPVGLTILLAVSAVFFMFIVRAIVLWTVAMTRSLDGLHCGS